MIYTSNFSAAFSYIFGYFAWKAGCGLFWYWYYWHGQH